MVPPIFSLSTLVACDLFLLCFYKPEEIKNIILSNL